MFQLGTRFWFIGTLRHEINVFNLQPWTCASASTLLRMEYHSFYSPGLDFSLFLFLLLCALYPGREESKEQLITHNNNQFCQGIWHALCYYHRKHPYLSTEFFLFGFTPPSPPLTNLSWKTSFVTTCNCTNHVQFGIILNVTLVNTI